MQFPNFVGGSNLLSSDLENCERAINLRQEAVAIGKAKTSEGWLPRTPGLRFAASLGSSKVECLFYLDGRAFGVSGTQFFEFFSDDSVIVRGTVANDGVDLATMCSGGSASDTILVIAGSAGYVFTLSTNAFAEIVDADFPANPVMCEFFAGYFLVLARNSRSIQWSALEDPTAWDALDVLETSWTGDNLAFIKRVGTHIWAVGTQAAEVLYATGDLTVFAPAQESLIEHGCVARFSGQRIGENALAWLDQSERGLGQVVIAKGITPETISTYAISLKEQGELPPYMNAAAAFVMQIDGHQDYVLTNTNSNALQHTTPVFDLTENVWHERATWNSTACVWEQYRPLCHMAAFENHYVGDSRTGAIYQISQSYLTEQLADVA